ncbi:FAD-binding oxidoreductase [uncultured Roseovarius sp.]|uniref:NAD(P)/FAD-dependent oxidoreductase n=1 Tax=uncultured Roseovarius sp. TaxID=293344 RepID=UPI00262DBD0F|nr:FAD-binding oxidoreductase [uncultured Roseovarius sp.]
MTDDVTILGAGIVGICCALSLAERGAKVRLIDKGDPGQETSFGNAGVISPWSIIPQSMPGLWKQIPKLMFGHFRPLSVRPTFWPRMVPWGLRFLGNGTERKVRDISDAMDILCGPSVDLYRRHLEGTGHEDLVRDSLYVHAFRDGSRASLQSLDYRIRQEKGAPLELVGADELRRVEPALSHDFNAAVLIHGQARALSPGRIAAVLASKAKSLGVEILNTQVIDLTPADGAWKIQCESGPLTASQVVVAMGAWSMQFLRPLGINLPLVAERGYHVEFTEPGVMLNNSITDTDAKFVASSMEGGLRVAGQAEFGDVDAPPNQHKSKQLLSQAKSVFPDLNDSQPNFWMGRRPSFPDNLPILGKLGKFNGLYGCFGHSHYGLMMAPKSGELLAAEILGQKPNLDLTAFSASRFSS